MTTTQDFARTVVVTLTLLLLVNSAGFSQLNSQPGAMPLVRDVALEAGGVLQGRTVDREGQPVGGRVVSFWYGDKEVARTHSDAEGSFTVRGLRGGVHQLLTRDDLVTCRLWAPSTAPPAARDTVILFSGAIVRGQCGGCQDQQCYSCAMVQFPEEPGPNSPSDIPVSNTQMQPGGDVEYVGGGDTGYYNGGRAGCFQNLLTNRRLVVAGGLIAAAIVIPLAVADDAS